MLEIKMVRLRLHILLCDYGVVLSTASNEQQHEIDEYIWQYAMRTNTLQVLSFFFLKN